MRVLIGSLALLQLAVAPALSLLDGEAALAESGRVAAHVEAHSTPKCEPPHAADCGVCQFLSSHLANVRSLGVAVLVVRHASVARERLDLDTGAIAANFAQSRAPPVS